MNYANYIRRGCRTSARVSGMGARRLQPQGKRKPSSVLLLSSTTRRSHIATCGWVLLANTMLMKHARLR